jgi:hypothetical protein
MRMAHRRAACGLSLLLLLASATATAQSGPDLSDLVVEWARGRYASPVMCELEGSLVRGIRRVIIGGERMPGRTVTLELQFIDMRPGEATRCVNATGRPQPNALGKLQLRLPGHPHPETAKRDFKQTLKQERGFDFEIAAGRLKLQSVAVPPAEPRVVDFRGGHASIGLVQPATDAERELRDFKSPRKLVLELESPKGDALKLPIFLFEEG